MRRSLAALLLLLPVAAAAHDGPEPHTGNFPQVYTGEQTRKIEGKLDSPAVKKEEKKAEGVLDRVIEAPPTRPPASGGSAPDQAPALPPAKRAEVGAARETMGAAGTMRAIRQELSGGQTIVGSATMERELRFNDRVLDPLRRMAAGMSAAAQKGVDEALTYEMSGAASRGEVLGKEGSYTVVVPSGKAEAAFKFTRFGKETIDQSTHGAQKRKIEKVIPPPPGR